MRPKIPLLDQLKLRYPIIQAPMAGVSTPELAAAVSNSGALGSIGLGAVNPPKARAMIQQVRQQTEQAFNVNVFVHKRPPIANHNAWIQWLRPVFEQFDAEPPKELNIIYESFDGNQQLLDVLLEEVPPVVSFHFGLPSPEFIAALKAKDIVIFATATNLQEAQAIENAGLDAVIAQGIEAGGHRGVFDVNKTDEKLGTLALTQLLAENISLPVIAAGGLMNGQDIAEALECGAVAAQLGTAFISCPESAADDAYRQALVGPGGHNTVLTSIISGRPARSLGNRFTALEEKNPPPVPDYPYAYDIAKSLAAAAKAKKVSGYGAQWAGQGAPQSRGLGAAELVRVLAAELQAAQARGPR